MESRLYRHLKGWFLPVLPAALGLILDQTLIAWYN